MDINSVLNYAEKNQNKFVSELCDLVRIPSVSFPDFDHRHIVESAEKVAQLMKASGLENIKVLRGQRPDFPYVFGEWIRDASKPTILLYAHHDVQPPMRDEVWTTPAFDPQIRDGRLYGRGSADDKAGITAILGAVESFLKTEKTIPCNIKVLIEGEEEAGSDGLEQFLKSNLNLLKSDVIVICDAENYDVDTPGITVSLRGMAAMTIEVSALKQPVHSGAFGGPIPDPAMALAKILAQLADDQGRPNIPGLIDENFYRNLKPAEGLNSDDKKFASQAGVLEGIPLLKGKHDLKQRLWFEPSISINAVEVGSRKQAGNAIMGSVWARFGIRTVAPLKEADVVEMTKAYIEKITPWGVKVKVGVDTTGPSWKTTTDHPAFMLMQQSLKKGWGKEAVLVGCGASIPFVQTFSDAFGGAPALLIALEDPNCKAHSENESLEIAILHKTIRSLIHFMHSVPNMKK